MIDIKTKLKIYNEILPYGFFWEHIRNAHSNSLFENFEGSEENFIELINLHLKYNTHNFINSICRCEKSVFIERIEAQYTIYTKLNNGSPKTWLHSTKDTIINGGLGTWKITNIVLISAFVEWYDEKISQLKGLETKTETTIYDFIQNVKNKENFLNDLKSTFNKPTDKGKTIKAIINSLTTSNVFVIPERQNKTFYDLLKIEFTHNIGSYQGIFESDKGYKEFTKEFLKHIEEKTNALIIKHEIK